MVAGGTHRRQLNILLELRFRAYQCSDPTSVQTVFYAVVPSKTGYQSRHIEVPL